MDNEQRKRMLEKSGEVVIKAPRYQVPIINFGGNSGNFTLVRYADKEKMEEKIESPLDIVILKRRSMLSYFGNGVSYFSTEFNSVNDKVVLFKKENGAIKQVGVGLPTDLRETNPLIKTHVILYVLYSGEVCKLEIKGGSISDFFSFQKAYSDEEKHSFELDTSITSIKTKNDAGFSFYKMVYKFTDTKQPMNLVEAKLDEVVENLNKIDDYNRQTIEMKGTTKNNGLSDETVEHLQRARNAEAKANKEFNDFGGNVGDDSIPF